MTAVLRWLNGDAGLSERFVVAFKDFRRQLERVLGALRTDADSNRSQIESILARVAALESAPRVLGYGFLCTDGVGGLTPQTRITGPMTARVGAVNIRVTFDTPRASLDYAVTAITADGRGEFVVALGEQETDFQFRVFDDTGSILNADSTIYDVFFIVTIA